MGTDTGCLRLFSSSDNGLEVIAGKGTGCVLLIAGIVNIGFGLQELVDGVGFAMLEHELEWIKEVNNEPV